ncbi:hypothetical protein PR048_022455 [Dryococelus australis]|uniref:Uncharacterized protein n=1 Tax=Dryococelus australis TaxID=614101 RepID=A0ABQ9H150_9NEOP|nr:hypothetical protein PR048_022455 [Dryococelus australis]
MKTPSQADSDQLLGAYLVSRNEAKCHFGVIFYTRLIYVCMRRRNSLEIELEEDFRKACKSGDALRSAIARQSKGTREQVHYLDGKVEEIWGTIRLKRIRKEILACETWVLKTHFRWMPCTFCQRWGWRRSIYSTSHAVEWDMRIWRAVERGGHVVDVLTCRFLKPSSEYRPRTASIRHRLACSPPTKANRALFPAGVTPGFSNVGLVPGDTAGRRVFSGISRFTRPSIPALLHPNPTSPSAALRTLMLRAGWTPALFCEIVIRAYTRISRYDGKTARLARRSDVTLGVRVSVARIAPSLLDLGCGERLQLLSDADGNNVQPPPPPSLPGAPDDPQTRSSPIGPDRVKRQATSHPLVFARNSSRVRGVYAEGVAEVASSSPAKRINFFFPSIPLSDIFCEPISSCRLPLQDRPWQIYQHSSTPLESHLRCWQNGPVVAPSNGIVPIREWLGYRGDETLEEIHLWGSADTGDAAGRRGKSVLRVNGF